MKDLKWTFFVEYPPEWVPPEQRGKRLQNLFSSLVYPEGISIAEYLQGKGWCVSVTTNTLDAETAVALKMLQKPVTLWITIPDWWGYWTNRTSVPYTLTQAGAVLHWADANNIPVDRLGIDLEIPLYVMQGLQRGNPFPMIRSWLDNRWIDRRAAQEMLETGVHGFGVPVEWYTFPYPMNKVLGGGLNPVEGGRQITMMYSSATPKWMLPWFMSLHKPNQIPAFGIMGSIKGATPGRMIGKTLPKHLSPEDLANDLRALKPTQEAYLFALDTADTLQKHRKAIL